MIYNLCSWKVLLGWSDQSRRNGQNIYHVRGEEKNVEIFFFWGGGTWGNGSLWRWKHRVKITSKIEIKELECKGVNLINLSVDRDKCRTRGNKTSCFTKRGEPLDHLRIILTSQISSAPWSFLGRFLYFGMCLVTSGLFKWP